MQGYLDIQILSEIFAVLSPESDCNLALMKRLIERELALISTTLTPCGQLHQVACWSRNVLVRDEGWESLGHELL